MMTMMMMMMMLPICGFMSSASLHLVNDHTSFKRQLKAYLSDLGRIDEIPYLLTNPTDTHYGMWAGRTRCCEVHDRTLDKSTLGERLLTPAVILTIRHRNNHSVSSETGSALSALDSQRTLEQGISEHHWKLYSNNN